MKKTPNEIKEAVKEWLSKYGKYIIAVLGIVCFLFSTLFACGAFKVGAAPSGAVDYGGSTEYHEGISLLESVEFNNTIGTCSVVFDDFYRPIEPTTYYYDDSVDMCSTYAYIVNDNYFIEVSNFEVEPWNAITLWFRGDTLPYTYDGGFVPWISLYLSANDFIEDPINTYDMSLNVGYTLYDSSGNYLSDNEISFDYDDNALDTNVIVPGLSFSSLPESTDPLFQDDISYVTIDYFTIDVSTFEMLNIGLLRIGQLGDYTPHGPIFIDPPDIVSEYTFGGFIFDTVNGILNVEFLGITLGGMLGLFISIPILLFALKLFAGG